MDTTALAFERRLAAQPCDLRMRHRCCTFESCISCCCFHPHGMWYRWLLSCSTILITIVQRQRLHSTNLVSTVLSSLCLCAALFTIIFASVVTNNLAYNTYSGTLNSWTCRWHGFDNVAPSNFAKICNDGMAALDLVIVLLLIELLALAATAWGWWVEMRLKKGGVGGSKSEVELV